MSIDTEPSIAVPDQATTEKPRGQKGLAKGALEAEVKRITDAYIICTINPPKDKLLTPHRISRLVAAERYLSGGSPDLSEGIDEGRGAALLEMALDSWNPKDVGVKQVSAGAITSMLKRWVELGFCTLHSRPLAFEGYTESAMTTGLTRLKEKRRVEAAAVRAATRAPEPEPEPVDTPDQEPSDPALTAPEGYRAPPALDDGMAGAVDPDMGTQAPQQAQTSPFGT